MKRTVPIVAAFFLLVSAFGLAEQQEQKPTAQQQEQEPIDFGYANKLYQKQKTGQTLTDDEKAYLERVKAEVRKRNAKAGAHAQRSPGGAANRPAVPTNMQRLSVTSRAKTGMVPLDEMTAKDTYRGQDGGLYGEGRNDPPPEQLQAAQKALAKVQKLDQSGKPSPEGKIVLLSVGMSNTANEFGRFKRDVEGSTGKSPVVVVVNGAQGGMTASAWTTADSKVWPVVEQRLNDAQVTAKQVQVVWLKQAIGGPFRFGEFPKHAQQLRDFLVQDINQIAQHYANVRVIYMSSRIYGGYAAGDLNPEPYAYESAYAVRWVIQDQIKGTPSLNFDPAKGKVKAPLLLWGPYLWADGTTPRKSDGLSYEAREFAEDGTHPSHGAQEKVSRLLQEFFQSELNAGWYVKGGVGTRLAE
jgi:hypothetical protein